MADEPAGHQASSPAAQVAGADADERHLLAGGPRRSREQAGVAQQRGRPAPGRRAQRLEHGATADDDGVAVAQLAGDRGRRVGDRPHPVAVRRAGRVVAGDDHVVAGKRSEEGGAERFVAGVTLPEGADEQHVRHR